MEPPLKLRFAPRLQRVQLQKGQTIHNQGQPVERVLFPLKGLIAIMSETLAGESVQTGMVGCDGAVGAPEALGSGQHLCKALVQIPGVALRLSAASYRELFIQSPAFRTTVERFAEMQLVEARQLMACNALHPVETRLSRAILEALERSCLERVLPLTQETLAQMLGAQRSTVGVFLSKLQRNGLIKNGRGAIEVRDLGGLERIACNCRKTLRYARDEVRPSAIAV
jgi:CRP-like cAMP-binding protein